MSYPTRSGNGWKFPHLQADGWSLPTHKWRDEVFRATSTVGPKKDTTKPRMALVAMALAHRATNETGRNIYPSVKTLVQMTGLSRSTVKRALKDLERDGWVERELGQVRPKRPPYPPVMYRLTLPPSKRVAASGDELAKPAVSKPKGVSGLMRMS